jgi:hypothetical protein
MNLNNKYKPNIEIVIERWKAFWAKDIADRIPIILRVPDPDNRQWEDACLQPEKYFQYWETILWDHQEIDDDLFPALSTELGPALMGGVLGCKVVFKGETSWVYPHPLENTLEGLENFEYDQSQYWRRYLEGLTAYFVEQSRGELAVGLTNLTGPGDIVTCLRGPLESCIDFKENPFYLKKLLDIATEAWLQVYEMQRRIIPQYGGGGSNPYMYWSPAGVGNLADDISCLLSPEMYQNSLLFHDQQIASHLSKGWVHLHSSGLHLLDFFLKMEGIIGIQVVNDYPSGPSPKEVLPLLKKIQQRHSLIIRKFTYDDLALLLPELSPAGLMVDLPCQSKEEACRILENWGKPRR